MSILFIRFPLDIKPAIPLRSFTQQSSDSPQTVLYIGMSSPARPENAIFEIADGNVIHYICQSDNYLTERDFDGELSPPEPVGSAKKGTAGAHLILQNKRAIYCLDEGNILQDFEFDEDTAEWTPGQLASFGVEAAPDTKFATVAHPEDETIYVFSQGSSGQIQALRGEHDWWGIVVGLPLTDPLPGASIHAVSVKGAIRVFYAHRDNSVHELVLLEDGTWRDSQVPLTDSASPKSHIVAWVESDECFLRFADGNGSAWVLKDGELVLVGRLTENGFQPEGDAEGHGPKELKW
ncbi:hypothetical protein VTN77DRAFT_1117 [Rasamsonia byssochlamydoides]|uniref:uncharacterized protein n=1 Tax=Rasamsonia byssochlamydoides TaxID=89139 RepID=UPI003743E4CB